MGALVLTGDTSGSVTVAVPTVAGTNTITLPATTGTALVAITALTVPNTTGTVMVSGNMPAFSAYMTASQTVSAGATTKLTFNAELFDTNNNFDSTTNYRFTPTVGGYYQINYCQSNSQLSNANTRYTIYLYKNGVAYQTLYGYNGTSGDFQIVNISTIVSMNGSTDYLEMYANPSSQSLQFYSAGSASSLFSGSLVRSA